MVERVRARVREMKIIKVRDCADRSTRHCRNGCACSADASMLEGLSVQHRHLQIKDIAVKLTPKPSQRTIWLISLLIAFFCGIYAEHTHLTQAALRYLCMKPVDKGASDNFGRGAHGRFDGWAGKFDHEINQTQPMP
jgi:hypothetical protein